MQQACIERTAFGCLPGGEIVERVLLRNCNGMSASVLSYGATLHSLSVPDRLGLFADVTSGYATLDEYVRQPQFFGSSVGRYANRIAGAAFTLDGKRHNVAANDGANSLHGGVNGFDKRNWAIIDIDDATCSVKFQLISPDGDQGYPGMMNVTATYRLDDENRLSVDYSARCDAPTIVNLTNHAYWNLGGEGSWRSALDHILRIDADHFLPVDASLIPTGEIRAVTDTPFDFRQPRRICDDVRDARDTQIAAARGYDHNWVLNGGRTATPRPIAQLDDPHSGRRMTLFSTEPGLQFYSGNFLDGTTTGKSGSAYRQGDAVALEPQNFPDAPNQPQFPSCRLEPGQTYRHAIAWQFDLLESEN